MGDGGESLAIPSRVFVEAEIDLDGTYEWGLEELARMVAEQEAIADQILSGAAVAEAVWGPDNRAHSTGVAPCVSAVWGAGRCSGHPTTPGWP